MSIRRRLVDLARANLNALLDRARENSTIDELTDSELEAELQRRKERRERVAFEEARRYTAEKLATPSKPSSAPKKTIPYNRRTAELYRILELDYGADLARIKSAYRRLMRKYHPDVHANDPTKKQAANDLAAALTKAYDELLERI